MVSANGVVKYVLTGIKMKGSNTQQRVDYLLPTIRIGSEILGFTESNLLNEICYFYVICT